MLINLETIQNLHVALSAAYAKGLVNADISFEDIATIVPSNNKSNTYAWLGSIPSVRKWVSDRILKELAGHDYSIKNEPFELTLGVDRDDIEDDSFGIYMPQAEMMAAEGKAFKSRLVWDLVANGEVGLGYDKVPFFSTLHPDGLGGTQSNLIAGAGDPWYVMDLSKPIKPFILQVRRDMELTSLTNPEDANVFWKRQYIWGIDGRFGAGYGFWQQAVASKKELNEENLAEARATMRTFSGDSGQLLGMMPTALVVGASNEVAGMKLVNNLTLATGESNVTKGVYKLIVSPYLP
jgi:phage major head subunit gpT-like protein